MISKRVERTEPGSFTDLAQYLVAAKEDGEKLDDLWIVNSVAGETINDLNMAIFEIEAQQGLNTKVKADKQYHLVVSFRDEKPSPEDLRDIERHFAKALGFEEHPRVVATHTNTDNYHMHVAYSRIHPKTYKSHWPEWDFPKRDKVCRAMEQKYGLKIDLGRDDKEQTSPLPQPARDMEAHTWEQSLAGYIQEHKQPLMAALGKANGWQDLHAAFGKYDLVLKKRGNGLIIGNRPTNQHTKAQHVKASSLDRSFSKAALEKRFGPYQAAERSIKPVKPVKRYERRPVTRHPHQSRLWRQYIGQRRSRDSLAVKAFKTWRDFLLYGIDDPLAMAIVMFHKKLIEAALGSAPSAPRPSIPHSPTFTRPTTPPTPSIKPEDKAPRVYLDVPFEDKVVAKSFGAKWDATAKRWYAPDDIAIEKFKVWIAASQPMPAPSIDAGTRDRSRQPVNGQAKSKSEDPRPTKDNGLEK